MRALTRASCRPTAKKASSRSPARHAGKTTPGLAGASDVPLLPLLPLLPGRPAHCCGIECVATVFPWAENVPLLPPPPPLLAHAAAAELPHCAWSAASAELSRRTRSRRSSGGLSHSPVRTQVVSSAACQCAGNQCQSEKCVDHTAWCCCLRAALCVRSPCLICSEYMAGTVPLMDFDAAAAVETQ